MRASAPHASHGPLRYLSSNLRWVGPNGCGVTSGATSTRLSRFQGPSGSNKSAAAIIPSCSPRTIRTGRRILRGPPRAGWRTCRVSSRWTPCPRRPARISRGVGHRGIRQAWLAQDEDAAEEGEVEPGTGESSRTPPPPDAPLGCASGVLGDPRCPPEADLTVNRLLPDRGQIPTRLSMAGG